MRRRMEAIMNRSPVIERQPDDETIAVSGYKKCPVCGSYETTRHAEHFRVWFTCNRCGAVFS